MKRIVFTALLGCCLPLGLVRGGPHPDFAVMAKARSTATEIFRLGNSAAAIAHLAANIRSDGFPPQRDLALIHAVAEVAAECYNRRDFALGKVVAAEAFSLATPVLARNDAATRAQRADLAGSLGLLKENLFYDWKGAEGYYAVALNLDAGSRIAASRQQAVIEKQKAKGRSGGAQ